MTPEEWLEAARKAKADQRKVLLAHPGLAVDLIERIEKLLGEQEWKEYSAVHENAQDRYAASRCAGKIGEIHMKIIGWLMRLASMAPSDGEGGG
jgi:hypothetical protein